MGNNFSSVRDVTKGNRFRLPFCNLAAKEGGKFVENAPFVGRFLMVSEESICIIVLTKKPGGAIIRLHII